MNGKTDTPARSQLPFSRSFITVLVALTIATLLLVFVEEKGYVSISHGMSARWVRLSLMYPWITAGGITISNGLTEFSGKEPELVSTSFRMMSLVGICLVFIVSPTLLLFGWKGHRKTDPRMGRMGGWWIALILGAMFVTFYALPLIPMTLIQSSVAASLRKAQDIQRNKDDVIDEIRGVVIKLQEYSILPKEYGGGEGKFTGFNLPTQLSKTENASYSVTAQDTLATIAATSILHPPASVSVMVDRHGSMFGWKYTGSFE
jgi:hypothetical protein